MAVLMRNRYGNIQPWDNSRIKLRMPISGSDYINASPIRLKSLQSKASVQSRSEVTSDQDVGATQDSAPSETTYIATQGPKEGQFSHFWHMVMQQTTGNVGVIIMLTLCYEGLKEKCGQYFPERMEDGILEMPAEPQGLPKKDSALDGDPFLDLFLASADTDSDGTGTETSENGSTEAPEIQTDSAPAEPIEYTDAGSVELLSLKNDPDTGSEVRELRLTIGDQTKTIYHYLYGKWPDFGKPEADDRIALLELTRVSKQVAGNSPRIVHCSAGVGRTGTWIALDFLLRELEEGRLATTSNVERKPSNLSLRPPQQAETWGKSGPPKSTTPPSNEQDLIHDTVDQLRIQRMMMVMNELQYAFIYEVLRDAFIEKYAEKEAGVVVTQSEEPSPKYARTGDKTRSQEEVVSEAETEMIDPDEDPYAAVAPERIMQGLEKDKQEQVEDHEVTGAGDR